MHPSASSQQALTVDSKIPRRRSDIQKYRMWPLTCAYDTPGMLSASRMARGMACSTPPAASTAASNLQQVGGARVGARGAGGK